MSEYTLSQISIYPVKSLQGINLNESEVEERGFKYDRRWMLIDDENMFITQRSFPEMVFIQLRMENDRLFFSHRRKNIEPISISLFEMPREEIQVQVWDDNCTAMKYGQEINGWFSKAMGFECKLVYMPHFSERKTSTKYYTESKSVSFADGYPYLLIGEESLKNLNKKLHNPVAMDRFRPNIVFHGGEPHAEDNWKEIYIGEVGFTIVKPCSRCIITTVDPETGKKGKEPLLTLHTYRNFGNKILFGQNTIAHNNGCIKVGDRIKIRPV